MEIRNLSFKVLVIIIFGSVFISSISSCKEEKRLRFPDVIKTPDINTSFPQGLSINLVLKEENLKSQDSIVIMMDGSRQMKIDNNYFLDLPTEDIPLGYHKLSVVLYKKGESKTIDLPFHIVSDIDFKMMTYTVKSTIKRDTRSYTQGLEMHDGILYESGGQLGESLVRKVNPKTGAVIKNIDLEREYFAEGLTVLKDKVYQLTWQNGACFIYDTDLNLIEKTTFKSSTGEGWGLCNDGTSLIMTDGSNRLIYVNPETLDIEKTVYVYAGSQEVKFINELEYVDGYIYANVYTTDQIAKIEAKTGKVVAVADFKDLDKGNPNADVLNGIAYMPETKSFIVTGKYWGKLYEINFAQGFGSQ